MQAHDLAFIYRRADGDPAGFRIGPEDPPDEKVALLVLGLAAADDNPDQHYAIDHRSLPRRQLGHDPLHGLQRGPARELVDDVTLGGGDRHLGPERSGALGHAGEELDAFQPHSDRPAVVDLVTQEQGRLAVERAGAREPAEDGHAGRRACQLGEHHVGRERVRVREQDHAARARQLRQVLEAELIGVRIDARVERSRLTRLTERRHPDRNRGAAFELAAPAEHPSSAAADQPRIKGL